MNYLNFIFTIENYKIIRIQVDGKELIEDELINTPLWDIYQNVATLLHANVSGISKKTGDPYFFNPYRYPLIESDILMDYQAYKEYIKRCKDKMTKKHEEE